MTSRRSNLRGWVGLLAAAVTSIALTVVTSGIAQASTAMELKSEATGKCIDVKSEDVPWNAQVQQWSCSGTPEQNWTMHSVGQNSNGKPVVTLEDHRTRGCMTIAWSAMFQSGANVRETPCTPWNSNFDNQKWVLMEVPFDTNIFTFVQFESGMCLDLRGSSGDNGAHIQQYTCNGTAAQRWHYQPHV